MSKYNSIQYCKKCSRDMRFEFAIRDDIWNKISLIWRNHVLCIECFLEELNKVDPNQKIKASDFSYMCILDPTDDERFEVPKLVHPSFGGVLINKGKVNENERS